MLLQGVKTMGAVALLLALGHADARPMDVDQWPSTEVRLLSLSRRLCGSCSSQESGNRVLTWCHCDVE